MVFGRAGHFDILVCCHYFILHGISVYVPLSTSFNLIDLLYRHSQIGYIAMLPTPAPTQIIYNHLKIRHRRTSTESISPREIDHSLLAWNIHTESTNKKRQKIPGTAFKAQE